MNLPRKAEDLYAKANEHYNAKRYDEALPLMKEAAEMGEPDALCGLALMYEYGRGVEKDLKASVALFREAAEKGAARGQFNLGFVYYHGRGVEKDYNQAFLWYRKAAEQGHPRAQNELGDLYYYGRGVLGDDGQAAHWYRKAAEQGYAQAQYNYGYLLEWGQGVERDKKQATEWYRKAAEQGYALAQEKMGDYYLRIEGIKNSKQVYYWYRKAAEQGCCAAQYYLGFMYDYGLVVESDEAQALMWYTKAAEQGDARAQERLAEKQKDNSSPAEDEKTGTPKLSDLAIWFKMGQKCEDEEDYAGARKWYLKIYATGDRAITHDLDRLYWKIKQTKEQDAAEDGLEPYKKAVRIGETITKNDPKRLLDLGMSLITGADGGEDVGQGLACIKIAAEVEYPEAMHLYAKLIAEGLILDQDLSNALIWALKALKRGFPDDGLIDLIQEKLRERKE